MRPTLHSGVEFVAAGPCMLGKSSLCPLQSLSARSWGQPRCGRWWRVGFWAAKSELTMPARR